IRVARELHIEGCMMTDASPRKRRISTAERLPKIRLLVGTVPAKEIAETLGISVAQLYNICSKNGISLACERRPRDKAKKLGRPPAPPKQVQPRPLDPVTEESLEAAGRLLRNHGWTVIRPDPFLDLKRRQLQRST